MKEDIKSYRVSVKDANGSETTFWRIAVDYPTEILNLGSYKDFACAGSVVLNDIENRRIVKNPEEMASVDKTVIKYVNSMESRLNDVDEFVEEKVCDCVVRVTACGFLPQLDAAHVVTENMNEEAKHEIRVNGVPLLSDHRLVGRTIWRKDVHEFFMSVFKSVVGVFADVESIEMWTGEYDSPCVHLMLSAPSVESLAEAARRLGADEIDASKILIARTTGNERTGDMLVHASFTVCANLY